MNQNDQKTINAIRVLSAEAIQKANSGHPGLPLGAAPAAYTLWQYQMKQNPANPDWKDRDRFVLSAGHGSMLLYSLLHLYGFGLTIEDLKGFRQWGTLTPGHPEVGHTRGVETTTGPLGQGVSNAVGMAMAEAHLAAIFNREGYPVVDHRTYALVGDGCLMEGISGEACSLAGTWKLGKLTVLYDSNCISIEGSTDIAFTEDVAKRYGDHLIFEHATFTINRGDKVAFVGKNGEGKSTLVKCIMGEITDFTGKLQLGHNVKIGYFAQNQAQLLDENMTVFDTVDYVAQGDIRLKIRDILGAFMFGGEASDKKVKVLSGGEKTRLAMIRLLLEPVNLLILDEPTNHLDMRSKDVLKDALKEFDGTVIVVSHDREFLDGLVDKVYEFGNKRVIEHLGGIYDFLEHKKMDSLCELERSTQTTTSMEGNAAEPTRNKLSYEARKEQSKAIKKVEKAIAESEKKITELENSIAAIEAKLATPEGAADVSLYTEYSELKKKLSDTMDLWTEQTLELEELNAANS